jgi:hypothetical protein
MNGQCLTYILGAHTRISIHIPVKYLPISAKYRKINIFFHFHRMMMHYELVPVHGVETTNVGITLLW